ncbi:uncharacterized protein LOC101855576 [Aplysia californica]|uniref:Uncharacterized protein LOC101855576 n=1 Tax=Aplysia californica TaxID=6500 RepID=A0ABM0JUM1_APLCA|nr:uncharacterized protein LOC101855576 [Aplysia californica]
MGRLQQQLFHRSRDAPVQPPAPWMAWKSARQLDLQTDLHSANASVFRTPRGFFWTSNTDNSPDVGEKLPKIAQPTSVYPKIPQSHGFMPLSSMVIFVYFLGVPLLVLLLYILWSGCQALIMWVEMDPGYEEENDVLDDKEKAEVLDTLTHVAPILTKLPPDFTFPPYCERHKEEILDDQSDVLRSSNGSLISLPNVCKFFCICSCKRPEKKPNGMSSRLLFAPKDKQRRQEASRGKLNPYRYVMPYRAPTKQSTSKLLTTTGDYLKNNDRVRQFFEVEAV